MVRAPRREPSRALSLSPPEPAKHDGPPHIDRFLILDRIGAGAMGELFVGWDQQLSRKLAIKLVRPRAGARVDDEQLASEAKALARISHPNVVQVFDVGVHDGRVFVAMEFVEGQTLRAWQAGLELDAPGRVAAVLDHYVAAGRGLAAVHAAGLVHNDFKPSNVVVGGDGRVRVVDFGLADALDELDEDGAHDHGEQQDTPQLSDRELAARTHLSDATMTDTELLVGTPRYMAPEQWSGRRGDERSDQFSFCVALYEALHRVHPYAGEDVEAIVQTVARGRLRASPTGVEVPAPIHAALERGLSRDPSQRFASMTELLDELEQRPPAEQRRSAVVISIAGVALVLVLLSLTAWAVSPVFRQRAAAVERTHELSWHVEVPAAIRLAQVERDIAAMIERGQLDDADASFAAFAELPAHAGTLALARGWLHQAERLAGRGDVETSIDAYAAAYLSNAAGTQLHALFGLARVFHRTDQWHRLGPTLHAIEQLAVELDDALAQELRAMRFAELVSRRDLAGASAMAPAVSPHVQQAIAELAQVTRTEHELSGRNLRLAPAIDVDGDGIDELAVYQPGRTRVSLLDGADARLEPLAELELERPITNLHGLDDGYLGVAHGSALALHRLIRGDDAALSLTRLWTAEQPGGHPPSWTTADLDRDGWTEVYVGLQAGRRLLGAEDGELGWVSGVPHAPTDATNSVINDVLAADLDGDGDEELIVLAGEWSAYDMRVLAPTGESGELPKLELLARRKLGTVHQVATLPSADGRGHWLAISVGSQYPSRRVWPAERPHGEPGVYVLAWDGQALREVAFIELPAAHELVTGDFDGNGTSDIAVGVSSHEQLGLELLLQRSAGQFERLSITGLWPVVALDRDRNGDDELLALTVDGEELPRGRLYVLGAGAERLPIVAAGRSDVSPPDGALAVDDEILRAAIARAENLATLGLPLRAAAELDKLARVTKPELAASLRVRAAELFEARGYRLAAAESYAEAAREPALLGPAAVRVRTRAMQLYAALHRFVAAADMAAAALELADDEARAQLTAERERLAALTVDEPRLRFAFDDELDDRWWLDPLLVRHRKGRLAVAIGGPDDRVVARREIQWDGGRLALELELALDVVEWSSEVRVALVPIEPVEHAPFQVGVWASGGGGIYQLGVRCIATGKLEPGAVGHPIALPRPELPEQARRFVLRTELVGDRRWCTADGPGHHAEASFEGDLAPGRYELIIGGFTGHPWDNPWALATASIERIEIIGAREPDTLARPRTELDAVRRELVEARPEAALARLDALHDPSLDARELALLRFVALDELGRTAAAERSLLATLALADGRHGCREDPRTRAWVGLLLRTQLEHLGPTLRRACGDADYFASLAEVWEGSAYQHPEAESVLRMLANHTDGLERWQAAFDEQRRAFLWLACARARARSDASVTGPVLADLRRAVELGDGWQAEAENPLVFADVLGRCRASLAAELLDVGDEAQALAQLRDALARSPTPEILADMLAIDPRFASLRARAQWQELIDQVRGG